MPDGYDFSVRNVNWKDYKDDYILRTDAVWERSKLMDYFYSLYKIMIFEPSWNKYMVHDLRTVPLPTGEPEHLDEWQEYEGFSEVDGCIWQIKTGPMIAKPESFSRYVADKEGDSWFL